jgi:hypothetical protein
VEVEILDSRVGSLLSTGLGLWRENDLGME